MRNLPKEKRDRLVLVCVTTLILLVTIWQALIGMQNRALTQLDLRRQEEDTRVQTAKHLVQSVEQIRQNLARKSEELKAKEEEMASGDKYSWIITKINKFKEDYKVEIPQFSREVPCKVGPFAEFPYEAALFNIRGFAFYHDFGRFLADFENKFPYLRVQNIELEPAAYSKAGTVEGEIQHAEKLSFRMEIVTLINPNGL